MREILPELLTFQQKPEWSDWVGQAEVWEGTLQADETASAKVWKLEWIECIRRKGRKAKEERQLAWGKQTGSNMVECGRGPDTSYRSPELRSSVLLHVILRVLVLVYAHHMLHQVFVVANCFCHLQLHNICSNKSLFPCAFLSISTHICSSESVLPTLPLMLLSVESTRLPLCLFSIDTEFFTCFCFAKCFLFRNWHHRALQAKRYGSYFWLPSVC